MGVAQSSEENPANDDSMGENLLQGPANIFDILDILARQSPLGMAEITVNRNHDSDSADNSPTNEGQVRLNVIPLEDLSESDSATSLSVPNSLVTNRRPNRLGRVTRRSSPANSSDSSNSLTPQVSSTMFLTPRLIRVRGIRRSGRNTSRSAAPVRSILRPNRNDSNHPAARPTADTTPEVPLVTVSAPSVLTPPNNFINSFFERDATPQVTRNTPRTVRPAANDLISSMYVQPRNRSSIYGELSGPIMAGDIVQEATPVRHVSFADRLGRRRSSRSQNLGATTRPGPAQTIAGRRQVRRRFNTLLSMIRRAHRNAIRMQYQDPNTTADALEGLQTLLQNFSTELETLLEEVQ